MKRSILTPNKGFNSAADSVPSYKSKCRVGWFMFFCIEFIRINPNKTFILEFFYFLLSKLSLAGYRNLRSKMLNVKLFLNVEVGSLSKVLFANFLIAHCFKNT